MLIVPTTGGAAAAVCDNVCLARAVGLLHPLTAVVTPELTAPAPTCATCYACGLTVPSERCLCRATGTSCTADTWLFTSEPQAFLDVLHEFMGPGELTDAGWDLALQLAELVWAGPAVAVLWLQRMLAAA